MPLGKDDVAVIDAESWFIADQIAEWCDVSVCLRTKRNSLLQTRLIEFTMPDITSYVAIAFQKNSTFYPQFERVWHALTQMY